MKKFGKILTGFMICAVLLFRGALPVAAADGIITMSLSKESITQGDSLTLDVAAKTADGKEAVSVMRITYDPSVLSFVGCSETCGAGNGLVSVTTNQATITLKAVGSGESTIEVTGEDGVAYDSAEELSKMTGTETTVVVNPVSSTPASVELSSLAVSEGALSPAFTPATREYTTVVSHETTSIAVNAKTADSTAKVQSLSGNTNLAVGDNPVTVVVQAENGATETYTIHVVRAEEGQSVADAESAARIQTETSPEHPGQVVQDGMVYEIADTLPADLSEPDFVTDTLSYRGGTFSALRFEKNSDIYLVSMKSENGTEGIYVFNRITGQFSPFVKLQNGDRYIIILTPPAAAVLPAGYVGMTLDLHGQGDVTVYQKLTEETEESPNVTDEEEFDPSAVGMLFQEVFGVTEVYAADLSDFYLMYAVNNEGKEDWYQYDLGEDTYQRYAGVTEELVVAEAPEAPAVTITDNASLDALQNEFANFRKTVVLFLIAIAAGFLLLLILLIVLGVQLKRAKEGNAFTPGEGEPEDQSLWEEMEDPYEEAEADVPEEEDLMYTDLEGETEEADDLEDVYDSGEESDPEDAYDYEEENDGEEAFDIEEEAAAGEEDAYGDDAFEDEEYEEEPEKVPVEKEKKKRKGLFGKKEEKKTLWEEMADEDEAAETAGAVTEEASDTDGDIQEETTEEPVRKPRKKEEKPKKKEEKGRRKEEMPRDEGGDDSDEDLEVLDLNDL